MTLWIFFDAQNEVVGDTSAAGTEPAPVDQLDTAQLEQLVVPSRVFRDLLALVLGAAASITGVGAARRLTEQRNSGEPINYEPNWHQVLSL